MEIKYIELICGTQHHVSIGLIDDSTPAWMGWVEMPGDIDNIKHHLNNLNTTEILLFFQDIFALAKPQLRIMKEILGEIQYTKGNLSFITADNLQVNSFVLNSNEFTVESLLILFNDNTFQLIK